MVSYKQNSGCWCDVDETIRDGFTSNGVLLSHPVGEFMDNASGFNIWSELSVLGYLYCLTNYSDRKKNPELMANVLFNNFPLLVLIYV